MDSIIVGMNESVKIGIIQPIKAENWEKVVEVIRYNFQNIYASIPDEKRISRGRVYVIRYLTKDISILLEQEGLSPYKTGREIFRISEDFIESGVALGLLTISGERQNPENVFEYFKQCATSRNWDLREISQMFFRRIIRTHPDTSKRFLQSLASSPEPNLRRFVAESLRPVGENRWIHENPEYSLEILKLLFKEKSPYPRTAVGNNLSDLSKKNPEIVFDIVEQLIATGNRNSRWIAHRACRNLVKKYPERVLDLLEIEEYRYKNKTYRRNEHL